MTADTNKKQESKVVAEIQTGATKTEKVKPLPSKAQQFAIQIERLIKDNNEPTPEEIASAVVRPVKGETFTICGNAGTQAQQICEWDTALTLSGAFVFTPTHAVEDIPTEDLDLCDFVQNKKIDRSDSVIAITNKMGVIDSFMIPWLMHAFTTGKKVYVNTKLSGIDRNNGVKTVVALQSIKTLVILRPHYLYHITRDDLEDHLRFKRHLDTIQAKGKQLEGSELKSDDHKTT